jgi:glucosyl-dolichyl phosphate glucuronosyltransferase
MKPVISCVICTYNRDKFIIMCLESLSRQNAPKEQFEVIVVDNASTDGTANLVKSFLNEHSDLPFRYVFEPKKGLSNARNRGIEEAKGEIVLYLDDDAESEPNLISEMISFFEEHPEASGAGGRILPIYSEMPEPEWASKWLNGYFAKMDPGGSTRVFKGRMKYPFGCNMAYRKKYLEEIGGFNTKLAFRGDDKHVYHAVRQINPNIYFVHTAVVHHHIPTNRLSKEYFRTLFLKTGNEEKLRISEGAGWLALVVKFLEYVFKLSVSVAIWILYALKGNEIKGRFVLLSQWYTLRGFLMPQVHVR